MRRRLLLLALAAVAAGSGAPAAQAGSECEGLIACIRVVGPWVQVPGGASATTYRLSCPGRGQIVGGLDADRSGPLDLSFLGSLGGPVSPGITTRRTADFVARTPRAFAAFRPLLGCIPAAGGGGRSRTSYRPTRQLAAAAPAVEALIRRVRNVRLTSVRLQRPTRSCLEGERLLTGSASVAFHTRRAPTLSVLRSVRVTVRRSGRAVIATARSGVARPVGTRVDVQVHALCVRGPS